jgi:choice-of-anchor B domain-containing protein
LVCYRQFHLGRIYLMRIIISSIMLLAIAFSQDTFAHAEHDKARFVAVNGRDQGQCNNRFRPCNSIAYAAQQAAKGDRILVAQGKYQVKSEEDLFYLIGQVVPVLGGYDRLDNYQGQNPNIYRTTVSGVPLEFAEQLSAQGFKIIRDQKGLNQSKNQAKSTGFARLKMMQGKQSAASCIDGSSAGFSCKNMSLLAHMPNSSFPGGPSTANDIWGHIDLNTNKEYAIIGLRNGISVVDVSTPDSPQIIDSISGQSTTWRDIKVHQFYDLASQRWRAYAYATADNVSEGLTIIDLSGLPNSVRLVTRQLTEPAAHNVYISNVDYGLNIALPGLEPLLHIAGSDESSGALRSYRLDDPELLALSYQPGSTTSADYSHDLSSLLVKDERAQSDCINANESGCNVLLDFNENVLRLWDHSNPEQAVPLSTRSYPNVAYTHSGWWSEDKQFVIVHDELDERNFNLNTTLNIFDITRLSAPLLTGTWTGPTGAIDHNGFVRGNRYYMSNYERGLTVLDITDPSTPVEVAYFDTYPVSDNAAFNGAWGVYPFLPSGIILVSDINSGLYILKDESLQSDTGNITINSEQLAVNEGDTVNVQINKSGRGSTTVGYEILTGSATTEDFTPTGSSQQTGELTWANDDTQARFIELKINTDLIIEPSEIFFVRLFNPRNGATVSFPNIIQIKITGVPSPGTIGFTDNEISLRETDAEVDITVSRTGGSDGEITVDYQLHSDTATVGEDIAVASGTLTWQDNDAGDQTIPLNLLNDERIEQQESLLLVLSSANAAALGPQSHLRIIIRDDESNQAPTADAGNDTQVNTRQSVQLNGRGSDPEQQNVEYLWQQVSGISVSIQNANDQQTRFTAPAIAGTLEFSLTVTDDFAIETMDKVLITVVAAPTQPAPTPPAPSSAGGGAFYWLALAACLLVYRGRKQNWSRLQE